MRIVVAIGGSILLQDYNAERFKEYAKLLKEQSEEHEIFVVVEVTRVNAKLLLLALGDAAYQRVPHNFQEALEFSASGKIIVMGGTEPAHSTDAVSAILAEYVQADLLVNLTAVDGLYTKDPKKYDDAELIEEITASDMMGIISGNDVKAGTYEFIDTTAIQMIKRSNLETVIANGNEPQNLIRAIKGEKIGTRVISE